MKINVKKLSVLGLFSAFAMVLAYLEILLPPIIAALPYVKIGLPNIVILFLIYKFGVKEAAAVSIVRVALVSLLFGSAVSFLYSITGAALSLTVMWLLKKLKIGLLPNSILGALSHNAGQVAVAAILMKTAEIFTVLPILSALAVISGILTGILATGITKILNKIKI